jgi:hypothetical protein
MGSRQIRLFHRAFIRNRSNIAAENLAPRRQAGVFLRSVMPVGLPVRRVMITLVQGSRVDRRALLSGADGPLLAVAWRLAWRESVRRQIAVVVS